MIQSFNSFVHFFLNSLELIKIHRNLFTNDLYLETKKVINDN